MRRLIPCSIIFALTLSLAACGGDDNPAGPEPEPEPTTGAVEVTVTSTGDDIDADGYTVSAEGISESISSEGSAILSGLSEGDVDTELSDLAANCAVDGDNSQTVAITAGDTTSASFNVECQTMANGKIAFTSGREGNGEVYLMNTDGSSPTKLTDNTADDWAGPISPNGTQIAFISNRTNSTFHLYVMDADGANVQQLTSSGALPPDGTLSWSPDGSTIAYVDNSNANSEIYSIGADGSGKQRLTNNSAEDNWPHWSPDGSTIIYSSDTDGDYEIYTMNPDGTGRQKITDDTDANAIPRWSPDGSKIAFASTRPGDLNIYTMNADGTNVQQITNASGENGFTSWSPDGSEITFYSSRDGNGEIYKINADGSGLINLTAHSAEDLFPYWSPVE